MLESIYEAYVSNMLSVLLFKAYAPNMSFVLLSSKVEKLLYFFNIFVTWNVI